MANQRVRFTLQDELLLLRDVCLHNPFECPKKWHFIAQHMCEETHKTFTGRNVRDRTDHILKLWVKKDRANLFRSGTEEEYGEKEQLLQEACDLPREFRGKCKKKKREETHEGVEARNAATEEYANIDVAEFSVAELVSIEDNSSMICDQNVVPGVSYVENPQNLDSPEEGSAEASPRNFRKGKNDSVKGSTLWYLFEKQKQANSLEERKCALKEMELKLEKEKWELEKIEKKERWELEKREREMILKEKEDNLSMEMKEREQRMNMDREIQIRRMKLDEANVSILSTQQTAIIELLKEIKK